MGARYAPRKPSVEFSIISVIILFPMKKMQKNVKLNFRENVTV